MTELKERKLILNDEEIKFESLSDEQKALFENIENHNVEERSALVQADKHRRLKESYANDLQRTFVNEEENESEETTEEGDS
tara:strand:+ start:123 stop:368 length:246 start_codon:yes stop_codon:yes gene_type:complete